MWTRTNAASIFTGSIVAKKDDQIAGLEDQKRNLMKAAQESANQNKEVAKINEDIQTPSPEFETDTVRVYSAKKIYHKDDLQQGRWGGSSRVGDYVLEASYDPSRNLGYLYGVTLTVKSLSNPNWNEEVAFFLHDTFASEIEYARATNGVAKVADLIAFEAFVVGARTSDKTELELDLNKVPGFPSGFYWS